MRTSAAAEGMADAGIAVAGVGRSAVLPRDRQDLWIGFGLTASRRLPAALDRLGDVLRSDQPPSGATRNRGDDVDTRPPRSS